MLPLTLSACGIWNAGDLHDWVVEQAVISGCEAETVVLEDWYTETDAGNIWKGVCADQDSGQQRSVAISVDKVWTPSEG